MISSNDIPVTILTSYLGAGKTMLLNRITRRSSAGGMNSELCIWAKSWRG